MAAAEMAQCTVEAIPTAMNEGMLVSGIISVSYTLLTLPTNREV